MLSIFLEATPDDPFSLSFTRGGNVFWQGLKKEIFEHIVFLLALQCRSKLKQDVIFHPVWTISCLKIGNSVISFLWQLWGRCNPDHNKFSSSFNTTMVAIFPKLSLWRRSLCSNLGGIGPEKLYRATLKQIVFWRSRSGGSDFYISDFDIFSH